MGTTPPELRRARHDFRGRLNALKLCVSALGCDMSASELVEFLDDIIRGADDAENALDALDRVYDSLQEVRAAD